jgi:hypothetical protein
MLLLATRSVIRMFNGRERNEVKKQRGHTWIEVNNEVHTFVETTKSTLRLLKFRQN